MSVAVAALALLARLEPATASTVSVAGAVWTAVYAGALAPWAARHQRTGAVLQEMLDTELFELPWNHVAVGERLPEDR